MSEYQYIAFQAIDRPLTDKELEYAESQSTRAEITRWSFTNEYHYGDFGGDSEKLLQKGYDVHLHYANFGIRTLMMRLPSGLPFPKEVYSPYLVSENIDWKQDKKGPGGILSLSPYSDCDSFEEIWEPGACIDPLVEIRNELVAGDLRVLYTLWLCSLPFGGWDSEEILEPPIPAGIGQAPEGCWEILEFYDIDPLILSAADEAALPSPKRASKQDFIQRWAESLPAGKANKLLTQLLSDNSGEIKAELISQIREKSEEPLWPTSPGTRTLEQLHRRAEELREEENARQKKKEETAARRKAAQQEKKRQQRMLQMKESPQKWIKEVDKLVEKRGTANYKAAADMLADIGEALHSPSGTKLVRSHAAHLAEKYPTLNQMKSSLRKRGLLK